MAKGRQEKLFLSTDLDPDEVISENGLFFPLYHNVFEDKLKGITEEELLQGDMLVSKVLRRALEA